MWNLPADGWLSNEAEEGQIGRKKGAIIQSRWKQHLRYAKETIFPLSEYEGSLFLYYPISLLFYFL